MKHRRIITALAGTALTLAVVAPSADAADTDATFTVTSTGSLGITVPASTVNLGSVTAGSTTFAPSLGTVTVTDTRAALEAIWTATATGTHFDLQTAGADPTDPNQRVPNTAVTYSAVPTVVSGGGTATPTASTLDGLLSKVAYVGVGSNEVTWNPKLTMVLLPTQVAGTYKGTITHSVS